jgi:phage gp45-like
MQHNTSRTSADRHASGLGRTTFEKADDTKLMQNVKFSGVAGEQQQGIEHVHPYGFVNVPKAPTQQQSSSGSDGSGSGQTAANQHRMAAESFMSFLGGARSHGVALVTGDRRYRLYKLAEGEVALHDDQGHQVHIRRDGVYVSAPNSKKIYGQVMADDTMPQEQGAKGGQIQQAGRKNSSWFQLDKDNFQLSIPGTMTVNANVVQFNAQQIITNGSTYLGATPDQANMRIGVKTTLTTDGAMLIKNLAKNVYSVPGGD